MNGSNSVCTFTLCSTSRIIRCGQHVLKTPGNTVFAPQQAGRGAGASFQQQQSEGEEIQKSYPTGEKHF